MSDRVMVRAMFPPGHVRTPAYLRGKIGTVERKLGPFANPEQRAYGHKGDAQTLFRVRFRMGDIWDTPENPEDTLDAEIYAHWLEPVHAT
jgi:nitrile hydratase